MTNKNNEIRLKGFNMEMEYINAFVKSVSLSTQLIKIDLESTNLDSKKM